TTYGQLTGLLDPLVVEYGFGDPQERPRVSEQESAEPEDTEEADDADASDAPRTEADG
ncbi:TlpA family protein disulfide reductase, partial [Nocardiopsis alba]